MRAPTQKELIAALQTQLEALQQAHAQLWKELARVEALTQAQDRLRDEVGQLRDQMQTLEQSFDRLLLADVFPPAGTAGEHRNVPPAGPPLEDMDVPPVLTTEELATSIVFMPDTSRMRRVKCWLGFHEPLNALRGKSRPQCLHCERFYRAQGRRPWREHRLARIVAAYLILAVVGFLLIAKVYPWLTTRHAAATATALSEMW